MNKIMTYLRWALVLPGAMVAGFLATFPLHWILYLAFVHKDATLFGLIEFPNGINIAPIEYLLYPSVMAAFYIIAGSKIAPKYKFKTAIVLFGIYIVVWSIVSAMVLFNGGVLNMQFSGRTILAVLGAVAGLFEVKITEKELLKNQ